MLIPLRNVGLACLALALSTLFHERTDAMDAPVLSARDVLPLMVYHTQGWGRLGLDTCAHGGSAEPLPLQIGDRNYAQGLGMHAPGETWLALEGRYALFEAEVGVQKQPQDQGSVVFRVYGDDALLFDSGVLRQSDGAKTIRVSVEGVNYLRLENGDGGDGLICDCADWVSLRLTPSPASSRGKKPPIPAVDMAPFGRILTWNPYIKDGTHARRTEAFPARDLFPGTDVKPVDGTCAIPMVEHPHADIGMGCIGVEWLEQRRIRRAELVFDGPAPSSAGAAMEYWAMTPDPHGGTPGVSRWQGHWEHLDAPIVREENGWSVDFPPVLNGWQRPATMKIRWLIPRELKEHRIRRLSAYSDATWEDVDVTLRALKGGTGESAMVRIYNGHFPGDDTSTGSRAWSLEKPLRLRVRKVVDRPWSRAEKTVLRLDLPGRDFGIAVDDIMESGCVYVESAGIVAFPAGEEDAAMAHVAETARGKTILEEVRALPDQTFAQALEHVHRPEADYGPTLLSLAHGDEKFLLQRNGSIGFDAPGQYAGQKRNITVGWEGQANESIERRLEDGWMPIPVITHRQDGVEVRQRTFVAPTGNGPGEGMASWYDDQPLCVAEYTFANTADTARPVALTFTFTAEAGASLRRDARGVVFAASDGPCALLDTTEAGPLDIQVEGSTITVSGALNTGESARCVLLIPGWTVPPEALPAATGTEALAEATRAHWLQVMNGTAQITTPDPMLNNLVRASRVHCMLAARNEEGKRIAPWIASTHYGPLESEAHSLVRGMAFMGHEDFARRGLEFFINRYNDEGYLTTGYTLIGTGWHLWALGEYYALNKNADWMRGVAPEVSRLCRWILAQREKTQQQDAFGQPYPEYGLMPPGVLADWGVYSHYFYLNGNYYAGLEWAGKALADVGWEGAPAMLDQAAQFRQDIRRAFTHVQGQAPVLPLRDGTWVPAYPTQLYCPMPIADMYWGDDAGRSWCYDVELGAHHLVPMGVLEPRDPGVGWMLNHMEDVQFLKSGWFYYPEEGNQADWFNRGGFAKVQPYYARNAEVCAQRDDVKPFIRNYFNAVVSLLNREDLSLWEHFMNGAFNKTHETGYFLYQSRLMFVMERKDALWLAPFVPSAWMADGQAVDVRDMPTFFGKVSYTLTSRMAQGVIEAAISPPRRTPPAEIVVRLRHPEGRTIQSADVKGARLLGIDAGRDTIRLAPSGGEITVSARF